MSKVLIVGGGAAGMYAAVKSAEAGHEVHVYEKNEKLGKKLFITGKGRCNITNACDMDTLFASVTSNPKFLYSAFYGETNQDVISFFGRIGVRTKVERGDRVFPESDHSSDVIRGLEREMQRLGASIHLRTEVRRVLAAEGCFQALELSGAQEVRGDACIIATGGLSYPSTGSTGDGYRFASELGHNIIPCTPSLVPFTTKESWVRKLQGLSLKHVTASVYSGRKCLYQEFGEMLFTHYGVSGPLILSASSYVGKQLYHKDKNTDMVLEIDLKPALSAEQLEQRILREFGKNPNKQFKTVAGSLFPSKLTPVMVELSGIGPDHKINELSRSERQEFVYLIKHLRLKLTGLRGYEEAVITKGGVSTRDVDPKTMESKIIQNIYFAGEVLDVDALTGGFNLQIAFSTAYAAAKAIAKKRT